MADGDILKQTYVEAYMYLESFLEVAYSVRIMNSIKQRFILFMISVVNLRGQTVTFANKLCMT